MIAVAHFVVSLHSKLRDDGVFFSRSVRNIQISLISSGDTKNQQFKELLIEIY